MSLWSSPRKLTDHPPKLLAIFTAILLALALCESILTVWIESPWNLAIPQVIALALIAVWCVFYLIRPYRIQNGSLVFIPVSAPILIGLIQLLTRSTIYRWNTWNAVLLWTTYLAVFWLALQLGARPPIRAALLRSLLWFGFLFSALSVATFYTGTNKIFGLIPGDVEIGYLGPFSNRDHFAAFIELLLPLALYRALTHSRRFYLGAVMAGMLYASIIAGASRAGSFLATLEILTVLILAAHRRLPVLRRSAAPLAAILVLTAAFTLAAGYEHLIERLQQPDPYLGRYRMLQSAREMFLTHPLAGFGLGNFEFAYPPFAHYDDGAVLTHAHNDWVEWTLDGGLPLSLSLLAVALLSAPILWRSLWALGILSTLLHATIDYPLHRPAIALWLFAFLGLAYSQKHMSNNSDF